MIPRLETTKKLIEKALDGSLDHAEDRLVSELAWYVGYCEGIQPALEQGTTQVMPPIRPKANPPGRAR